MKRTKFTNDNLIDARLTSTRSLFQTDEYVESQENSFRTSTAAETGTYRRKLPVKLRLVSGSMVGETSYDQVYSGILDTNSNSGDGACRNIQTSGPTLTDVARKVASCGGPKLDEKQYIAYEVICCSFLLGLVHDGLDMSLSLHDTLRNAFSDYKDEDKVNRVIEELKVRGGQEHLIMFLSGPAGAGKSSAIKVARRFCFEFCRAASIQWSECTFLFTAYTGTAAMEVGGVTICKAAFIFKKRALTEEDKRMWRDVKILIIDEISFMSDGQFQELDKRLKVLRDKNKPFGGFVIIFAGDFRQLEPCGEKQSNLLFSRESSCLWDLSINTTIFLNNEHRFKDDPRYGKWLKTMWKSDLPVKARRVMNTQRVVRKDGLQLPSKFEDDIDACFACPSNRERNAISAGNFKRHLLDTHPTFDSQELPPEHTIVVEADIFSSVSDQRNVNVDNVIRHRIITTCGDANVKYGTHKVDPALGLYIGAYLMCVLGNEFLRERVPRGSGTLCRLVSMKLKENAASHKYKNYYNRKVWTVSASDVEWIEVEHVVKTEPMIEMAKEIEIMHIKLSSTDDDDIKTDLEKKIHQLREKLIAMSQTRRFKMTPHTKSVVVKVKPHHMATTQMEFKCRMHQLPVNLNDATTGHKLQGMSKDAIIISSWPTGGLFRNWEYTVLSRVRTLEGLYLFQEISLDKSFAPSEELSAYFKRAKKQESMFLKRRTRNMKRFYS